MPDEATAPALVWFRDDLRVSDNPALHAAAATGKPILCLYVFDQIGEGLRPLGGASRWWLHHALAALAERLEEIGGRLDLFDGPAATIVEDVANGIGASAVFWNRRYGAAERNIDARIEAALAGNGVSVETFKGILLHEPSEVRAKSGGAFKVFTPFLRASMALGPGGHPLAAPRSIETAPSVASRHGHSTLDALGLLPTKPDWAAGLREIWRPGEAEAQKRLHAFLHGGLRHYGEERNQPALQATSGLSPYLRHGEISPRQVVAKARHAADAGHASAAEVDKFVSEVIWRDFDYNLLLEHPDLAGTPVQPAFADFPYAKPNPAALRAWQKGETGYPIVDAGMRQLWRTGVMHNRVRMIAASFLIKHMLTDWRLGERWFWDTLVDADPGNNPANWQWVAGCGADAAPYFRIFNPTLQGEKFDPKGDYVREFVPELGAMPPKWLHRPWEAPPAILEDADVRLGDTYPRPIVEHEVARDRALKALSSMRAAGRHQ